MTNSYFSIKELTANGRGLQNKPTPKQVQNLLLLCEKILDPARDFLGKPIRITSGFRNKELNAAVGEVPTSHHLQGWAADFQCCELAKVFCFIRDNLQFTQMIWEGGTAEQPRWIHVSYNPKDLKNEIIIKIKKQ